MVSQNVPICMGLVKRRYDDWVQAHPDISFNPFG